jgi:OFA family oxalate/formate antiporter-like MFS transporter
MQIALRFRGRSSSDPAQLALVASSILNNRWVQLALCVLVFFIISAPQYLWPLFVLPLLKKYAVQLSELQIVFSLVVVCMTFVTPFAGHLHDRYHTKWIIAAGVLICSGSWVLASFANSVFALYLIYGVLGGLRAGTAYIGCTGLVQKRFLDKRGLATGILMSGYAVGPLLTTYFVSKAVVAGGVEATLFRYGLLFLAAGLVIVCGLKDPGQAAAASIRRASAEHGASTAEMLRTPVFWLMFVMMAMITTCGMMITSNIAVIAKEYGVDGAILFLGISTVPLALMLDRCTNGASRILFGSLSDVLGRENTLGLAFGLEAVFMVLWFTQVSNPTLFVILSGLVFLAWGELFSIFPALCTDTFGERNASVNFGCLYASVGIGSIFGGPVAALWRESAGAWTPVFFAIAALDALTAILALTLLKKMRRSYQYGGDHA